MKSRAQSNVNNSAATDVIDEEWWRTSPRICKKSCVVQFSHIVSAKWDLAAAALHGARALSDTAGAHGSLSVPVYHSIDLATDNYRCFARLRGHYFVINNREKHIYAEDLAKNFVRAFSVREYFTAAQDDPDDHGNVELSVTAGLTFATYEAPPERQTVGGPLNPFKYPLEARRRHLAAYNALALIMSLFFFGMVYQDFTNHRQAEMMWLFPRRFYDRRYIRTWRLWTWGRKIVFWKFRL